MIPDKRSAPKIAANRPQWQFRLSHLFVLMTIAAVAAALVAAAGPGTLLTSGGILVAWLNRAGALVSVQAGRRQSHLLLVAWVTFLVSLALASVRIFGPVLGLGLAWMALEAPVGLVYEAMQYGGLPSPEFLVFVFVDFANLLMLGLPIHIWRLQRGGGQWYSAALAITMVSAWFVNWDSRMLVGYYVWCACFLVALVAIRVSTWTLMGMFAAAAAMPALMLARG